MVKYKKRAHHGGDGVRKKLEARKSRYPESSDDEDDDDSSSDSHTMQVCAGCDRAICLACHELEGNSEPALVKCECCSNNQGDSDDEDANTATGAGEFCLDCRSTCKFCNKVCCLNCSSICGHCGISLCPADSKFAVECWNCHAPFCLVCLASTTSGSSNNGCPQCHAKPSKKMSQLVHLRLKSIYRAFQQQSAQGEGSAGAWKSSSTSSSTMDAAAAATSMGRTSSSTTPTRRTSTSASGTSIVMKRNAQGTWDVEETTESGKTTKSTLDEWQQRTNSLQSFARTLAGNKGEAAASARPTISQSELKRQQEEADAAAAELLAELEQEEEVKKKKTKSKKKRGKKKSAEKEEELDKKPPAKQEKTASVVDDEDEESDADTDDKLLQRTKEDDEEDVVDIEDQSTADSDEVFEVSEYDLRKTTSDETTSSLRAGPDETEDLQVLSHTKQPQQNQDEEELLCQLVADEDQQGLEKFLLDLKGVPGKAALRKNAKKALKRMAAAAAEHEDDEEEEQGDYTEEAMDVYSMGDPGVDDNGLPLIQIMSRKMNHNPASTTGHVSQKTTRMTSTGPRAECVLNMSPQLVGWVIGKGGVRIRDLMEDTGTRIWIDQESMGPQEPRVMYISAPRLSMVDSAVKTVRELVDTAPGHATTTAAAGSAAVSSPKPSRKKKEKEDKSYKKEAPAAAEKKKEPKKKSAPSAAATASSDGKAAGPIKEVLTCEERYVPLLIGRRGWTIKHIQDTTGAKVDIDQSVTPRRVTVSGSTEEDVRKATRMVRDVLKYPHAQHPSDGKAKGAPHEGAAMDFAAAAKHDMHGSPSSVDPEIVRANFDGDVNRSHTPPPASLIMTGDSRSVLSATSSLSSTPEPSSVKAQLRHASSGPVMGSDYHREQYLVGLGGQPIPPPGLAIGHSGVAAGRSNSVGQIGGRSLVPELPLEQRPLGPPGGMPVSRASSGSDRNLYGQPSSTGFGPGALSRSISAGHGVGADPQLPLRNLGMMPPHLQQSQGTGGSFLPMERHPSLSGHDTMSHLQGGQSLAQSSAQQMAFHRQSSAPEQLAPSTFVHSNQAQSMGDLYRSAPSSVGASACGNSLGLFGRNDAVPTTQGGIGLGPSASYASQQPLSELLRGGNQHSFSQGLGSGSLRDAPSGLQLGYGRSEPAVQDDSNFVNTLFGSSGGGQELLSGLSGLSLSNNNNASAAGNYEQWGSSISGWDEEARQLNYGAAPQPKQESFLGGSGTLPSFLGAQSSQQQQQQQQQQGSRGHQQSQQHQSQFNWS